MIKRLSYRLVLIFSTTTSLMLGCGQLDRGDDHFISWGESSVKRSSIAKSLEADFRICLEGSMNSEDLNRSKTWATRAVLTWMRAIKLIDQRVSGKLTLSCNAPHLTLRLRQGGGTSFASPSVSTIYLTRPYGTWTHELGHAFAGLSDTYSGRAAGRCISGQPPSLMCWGAYGPRTDAEKWSSLWQDDVAGIQANYRKIFGSNLTPPSWAPTVNPEGVLDIKNPWPGYSLTVNDDGTARVLIDDSLETSIIDYDPNTTSRDL